MGPPGRGPGGPLGNEGPSGPLGGPQLVPASLGGPSNMDMPSEAQREVIPTGDGYNEAPATPPLAAPRPLAPAPMPQGGMDGPPMGAPAPMPGPANPPQPRPLAPAPMGPPMGAPAPMAAPAPMPAPTPMAAPAPAPMPAPSPAPMPAPARAQQPAAPAQPVAEQRSGDEYADALAQVIRTAKQRGAEASFGDDAARNRIRSIVEQVARAQQPPNGVTPDRIAKDALAEIAGTGAFEAIFEDGELAAAYVDHRGRVTTLRGGAHTTGSLAFSSPSAVAECTERLLRSHGIDRAGRSSIHATLSDGTRVHALFPPLAHAGAVVAVERNARPASLADLGARGVLPQQVVHALTNALAGRRNIVVSGARGSGRSTLLGALIGSLPHGDRVVVIEDRDELARARYDVLSVRGEGDWSEAVGAALSLRTGRVVFGEGHESCAKAFVSSLSTGADGALIAVTAPTGTIALARLAATAATTPWLTAQDAAARLLAARPLVIETARLGDGQCRVVSVGEVRPGNDGSLQVAPMFSLRIDGTDASGNIAAQLVPSGGY